MSNETETKTETKTKTEEVVPAKKLSVAEQALEKGWQHYIADRDHYKAEAEFRKAISKEPEMARAHYALGVILRAQKKNKEAIAAFKEAKRLLDKPDGELENRDRSMLQLIDWNVRNLK